MITSPDTVVGIKPSTNKSSTFSRRSFLKVGSASALALAKALFLPTPVAQETQVVDGAVNSQNTLTKAKTDEVAKIPADLEKEHIKMLQLIRRVQIEYGVFGEVLYPFLHAVFDIENAKNMKIAPVEKSLTEYFKHLPVEDINNFFRGEQSDHVQDFLNKEPEIVVELQNSSGKDRPDEVKPRDEEKRLIRDLFHALVLKDRGRVTAFRISDSYQGTWSGGDIRLGLGLFNSFDDFLAALHEVKHTTDGVSSFFIIPDLKPQMLGYRAIDCLSLENEWLSILANHKDFFDKYFFTVKGDELAIKMLGGDIQRVIAETIAISCVNYLVGEEKNWPGTEGIKAYPDIERAIRRQLAISVYGVRALDTRPDGITDLELADLRKRIGSAYLKYLQTKMSEQEEIENFITKYGQVFWPEGRVEL